MPGKVGVKIKAGRNLPVMDRGSETTDAYVEIKLGSVTHKTEVYRKSLNPQWNTDWFRFEVDDAELQDEPLQVRLMDYDTYSANDAIGKVNISLNPLCLENAVQANQGKGAVMSGWIPVFDTMHGIRGEVNIIVKVDLFSDANKFRQSSCGVQFFHSTNIPHGYRAQVIHGFVEELVVNDDPEYQWIDKIRTPRASNEARQVVFLKLSGQVQRKIGLKAINLGANAVIGYTQCFDLEGDVGVVARGIGTAVTLVKLQENIMQQPVLDNALIEERTKKYLEFLKGSANGDRKSVFDADACSNRSEDIVYKILGIEPIDRSCTRVPNIILNKKWRPSSRDETILEESAEETDGMKQLLHQEDMRGEKPPMRRLKHHVKRITKSSRHLLSEKFGIRRHRRSDDRHDHDASLNSSFSDISITGSIKGSLSDLRDMIRLKRSRKQPKFHRSVSDGSGMATVLVRSLMHGPPSLDSISEGHDSAGVSPYPCLQARKEYKSESMSNLSHTGNNPNILPDSKYRKKTFNVSHISISTASSISSTTTEECFSDDASESTTQNETIGVDADTVSMVVKSVLAQESVDEDSNNWIEPGSTIKTNDRRASNSPAVKLNYQHVPGESDSEAGEICILSGGTKILKQSKDSDLTETELVAESRSRREDLVKNSSHDSDMDQWIEPGSTTDEPETVDKERRGSLLHGLKENLTERFHNLQEHIHLPHFSEDKNKIIHKHCLLETAMETILIDKANALGVGTPPPFDDEDDIVQKNQCKGDKRRKSFDLKSKFHFPFCNKNKKSEREIKDDLGLLGTAMKSILMEQVNFAEEICEHEKDLTIAVQDPSSIALNTEIDKKALKPNFRLIPAISLNNIQQYRTEEENFYSSEPQLQKLDDSTHFPIGMPFISLTNLRTISTDSFASKLDNTNSPATEFPVALTYRPTLNSLSIHKDIPSNIVCSLTAEQMLNNKRSNSNSNKNNNNNENIQTDTMTKDTEFTLNIDNASDNVLSSSYLSTNKAPLLAPLPLPKNNRSELASVAAAAAATAVAAPLNTVTTTASASPSAKVINVAAISIGHNRTDSSGCGKLSQSPAKIGNLTPVQAVSSVAVPGVTNKDTGICRRSSDSDLSVTPKGNSICVASERLAAATTMMRINGPASIKNQENLDMLEYPFLTMAKYPAGFIVHLGATVAARSVKLLERVPNPDEPETRDSWWTELRMEIRSHARALGCNVVLGYSEVTTISDDVCVLSATGTAAVINMSYNSDTCPLDCISTSKKDLMVSSLDDKDVRSGGGGSLKLNDTLLDIGPSVVTTELSSSLGGVGTNTGSHMGPATKDSILGMLGMQNHGCFMCHIPYSQSSIPFNVKMRRCAVCRRGKVPDVLLATIEIPECLQITGRGCFMQAQVVRAKKDLRSESNAKEISDGLPFLEYELHRVLINKLKAKGMNAIFSLKAHVAIGEKMMALVATGTAVFLTALPQPTVPKIVAGNSWTDTARLNELQKSLHETVERNREIYQLKSIDPDVHQQQNGKHPTYSDTDDSEDELIPEMDLTTGNKDTCVLEVDDIEDLEIISLLMEPCPPEGFHVVNTQTVPGLHDLEVVKNLQMFTQVWRAKLSFGQNTTNFPKHFQRLLQTIFFKLRSMIPCAICDLKFRLDLPEGDEIQLLVTGMALGLGEPTKLTKLRRKCVASATTGNLTNGTCTNNKKSLDEDLIFSLDEDQMNNDATLLVQSSFSSMQYGTHSLRVRKNSPNRTKFGSVKFSRHLPLRDRYGVDVTPLSYVPGGKIEKYLGNLNFFFIRESTSVRENGGISGFVHSFITELLAVVRAHVSALGGNAIVSFYMTELILVDNPHKNQGQCLISIGGDVVYVSYYSDD